MKKKNKPITFFFNILDRIQSNLSNCWENFWYELWTFIPIWTKWNAKIESWSVSLDKGEMWMFLGVERTGELMEFAAENECMPY